MKAVNSAKVLLLPERRHFIGQPMSRAFLKHAKRFASIKKCAGEAAQLQRHFSVVPQSWPIAALLREYIYKDSFGSQWLCVDPVYIQAEIGSARMMACDGFEISAEEKIALLSAFCPLFGDAGFEFSSNSGNGFFIRALHDAPLPDCMPVSDMLGRDIHGHLPNHRKWLALFNECQIILHNHPLNVQRQRKGQLPINAFWFWGAGKLPNQITHFFSEVISHSNDINAIVAQSKGVGESGARILIDLRHCRNWQEIEMHFDPTVQIEFDFCDGLQWQWKPLYRWYFWRRRSGISDTY